MVLELVVPGLTVVEVAGAAVGVSTRARLSGPNKTVWARTEGALRHPPPPHPPVNGSQGLGKWLSRSLPLGVCLTMSLLPLPLAYLAQNDTQARCR
jgi:hypothetical protein